MRHLLALLDGGTHGTQAEPEAAPGWVRQNNELEQRHARFGTRGTLGTLELGQLGTRDSIAKRIAELADAYAERIAIVLEAGDISDIEARRIAEAEIGRRFVETFMAGEEPT